MVFHAATEEGEHISAVLAGLLKICNVQALGQCVFYEISTP